MAGNHSPQPDSAGTQWPPGRPPFRADHVGSLLRPSGLLRAREDFAAGRIGADQLREIEDGAIREVVRKQEGAGLRAATDGELRREVWHMDFIYQLGGITKVQDDTIRAERRTVLVGAPSARRTPGGRCGVPGAEDQPPEAREAPQGRTPAREADR